MPVPNSDNAGLAGPLEWAAATHSLPGESQSGDRQVVQPFSGGVLAAVLDAVGHGREAAEVADRAAVTLARHAHEPVGSLLQRCHEVLHGTRGAVVSLASFDAAAATATWVGVGNVAGVVWPATPVSQPRLTALVCFGGIVGSELPRARPALVHLSPGDTLVFATDGVDARFADALSATGPPQDVADQILARFSRGTDDALVLVARYRGPDRAGA